MHKSHHLGNCEKSSLPESQYVQRSIKQYNWKCKWVIVCMGPWSARSLSCVIFYREIFNQGTDNGWKSRWDPRSWSKGTMRGLCLNKLGIWLYRFQILKDSFRVWLTVNFLILCGCPLLASQIHPPSFPTDFAPRNWQMWPGGSGFVCSLVSGLANKKCWMKLWGREPVVMMLIFLVLFMPWHGTDWHWPGSSTYRMHRGLLTSTSLSLQV